MALNLKNIMDNPSGLENVILIDKDSLYVPPRKAYIGVQGRVNKPGLIAYDPKLDYMDYIELAGGFGMRADDDEIRVVKSRGEQYDADSDGYKLEPGDSILVPPEEDTSSKEFYEIIAIGIQLLTVIVLIFSITK